MYTPIRGGRAAAAALFLLAACGSDAEPAPDAAATGDTASLTVAEAPAAALDSARAAAARDDTTALSAPSPQPGPATAPGAAPAAPPVRAAPANPITADEVVRYPLSMDRIRQLVGAGQQLAELHRRLPEARDSMAVGAPDPNAILERLTNYAPAREAIGRAGLTPRDYTLSTVALMQAAMASQMRRQGAAPPTAVNEANVRLVTENWDEIQRLTREAGGQP
jgi:hypothetical protein